MFASSQPVLAGVARRLDDFLGRPIAVLLLLLTALFLSSVFFLAGWAQSLAESSDGVTTASGGRVSIFVMAAVVIVAITFRSALIWSPRWLSWAVVATTLLFVFIAGVLFALNRMDTAFALYGGFQVLRAEMLFSDTYWVLSWFDCDYCVRWGVNYGPSVALLDPMTAGLIGADWLLPMGILLTLLSVASLWLLAWESPPLGRWILVLGSISPAWLLLIDRANSDAIVLFSCIFGLWLVARHPSVVSWSLFATGIWIMGTIKFFPFAMGLVLLFALGIRRGWVVIVGFLAATSVFMVLAWDSYRQASQWTTRSELLMGDFPYYARIFISDQLSGLASPALVNPFVWAGLTVLVLLGMGIGWGISTNQVLPKRTQILFGTLALAGAIGFAGKVLWAGFGFMYTGAFLFMIAPAFYLAIKKQSLKNGVVLAFGLLTLIALFTAYNTTLATIAGLLVAGFGLGFGFRMLAKYLMPERPESADFVAG